MGKAGPPPVPSASGRKRVAVKGAEGSKRKSLQARQAGHASGFGKNGGSSSAVIKSKPVDEERIWQKTFFADRFRVEWQPSDGKGHAKSLYTVWKKSVAEERMAKTGRLDIKDKNRYWNYTSPVVKLKMACVGGGPFLMGSEEYYKNNPEELSYTVIVTMENLEEEMEPKFEGKPWVDTYTPNARQFFEQLKEFDELLIRALWEDPVALPEDKKELNDEGEEVRYDVNDEKAFKRFAHKIRNKHGGVRRHKETGELEWHLKTKAYKKMNISDWARSLNLTKKQQSKFKTFTNDQSKADFLKEVSIRKHGRIDPNFEAMKDDAKRDLYCYCIGYERVEMKLKEQVDAARNRWETIPDCKEKQRTKSLLRGGDYVMINFAGEPFCTGVSTATRYYMNEIYLVGQGTYERNTAPPSDIGATDRFQMDEEENDNDMEDPYPPQPYPADADSDVDMDGDGNGDGDEDMDEDDSDSDNE